PPSIFAIACFAHYLNIWLVFQDPAKSEPHQVMVVYEQDGNLGGLLIIGALVGRSVRHFIQRLLGFPDAELSNERVFHLVLAAKIRWFLAAIPLVRAYRP